MLSSRELAEALGHADSAARDQALFALASAGSRCGVMADVPLAVIDAQGANAFARAQLIRELPPSEQTLARLFAAYRRSQHPQVAAWITDLPQSLISAAEAKIQSLPAGELRSSLEARIEVGRLTAEALWQQLAGGGSAPAIQALLQHEQFLAAQVMPILDRKGDPLELIAIEMAGRLHLGTMLKQLLDRFADGEQTASAAVMAVARIGTAGAVTAIEQRCNRDPATFRLRASRCLGRFRVPSAEAALHRLLMEEDDSSVRCELARSLAAICTTTTFERICEMSRSGECPDAEFRAQLAGLAVLLKRSFPEMPQWRGRREVTDRAFADALQQAPVAQSETIPAVHLDAPADDSPEVRLTPSAPIRADRKVGRNDPCPCGSGRKYKKCCGS